MKNEAIVRTLTELADVMELLGESPFRVRAFRTASRTIEGLSGPVVEKLEKEEPMRGIGDGVIRRIQELVKTGKLEELEEARKKLPPGLFDLMSLPGVGIKTAQQFWKDRGITTIDELENAAKEGKLRDLPRFSEKKEEKLLASIVQWRKRASAPKRWPMAIGLDLAEAICARMRALPNVEECQFAGSLRRRRDTVGDLDILVAANASSAVAIMDAFTTMGEVSEILAKGETKSSVILEGGIQCDVRVIAKESFGAALQYFTGSKDHNVAMRTIAVKKGLKVSEYGVFDKSGKSLAGETEEGVYEAIGLTYMAPELRENRGEIEASKTESLPVLVELSDLIGDLHMHTTETDGRSSLEEMVEAAQKAGRKYIAITEHSQALSIARGVTPERLKEHVKRIRALDEKLGGKFRVLAGLEADILADGSMDLAEHLEGLDWVVGSVHSKLDMPREQMTKRVVKAIESGLIDVVGHPTGRMLGQREESALDLDDVFAALKRTGTAIELNCSPMRLDISESGARMARDLGVPVVLSSDAHSTRELGFLRYGIGIARRAWLGPEHVLTTRTVRQLADWRHTRAS